MRWIFYISSFVILVFCKRERKLVLVIVRQFEKFIVTTDHITNVKKLAWNVVWQPIYDFKTRLKTPWHNSEGVILPPFLDSQSQLQQ